MGDGKHLKSNSSTACGRHWARLDRFETPYSVERIDFILLQAELNVGAESRCATSCTYRARPKSTILSENMKVMDRLRHSPIFHLNQTRAVRSLKNQLLAGSALLLTLLAPSAAVLAGTCPSQL